MELGLYNSHIYVNSRPVLAAERRFIVKEILKRREALIDDNRSRRPDANLRRRKAFEEIHHAVFVKFERRITDNQLKKLIVRAGGGSKPRESTSSLSSLSLSQMTVLTTSRKWLTKKKAVSSNQRRTQGNTVPRRHTIVEPTVSRETVFGKIPRAPTKLRCRDLSVRLAIPHFHKRLELVVIIKKRSQGADFTMRPPVITLPLRGKFGALVKLAVLQTATIVSSRCHRIPPPLSIGEFQAGTRRVVLAFYWMSGSLRRRLLLLKR